jgi:hypothetical protein
LPTNPAAERGFRQWVVSSLYPGRVLAIHPKPSYSIRAEHAGTSIQRSCSRNREGQGSPKQELSVVGARCRHATHA